MTLNDQKGCRKLTPEKLELCCGAQARQNIHQIRAEGRNDTKQFGWLGSPE
jgi:hypothetical protein